MPKNITVTVPTVDDVKDKVEDAKESVEETVDSAEAKVNGLSTVKKVVLFSSAVVVGYSIVSAVARRVIGRKEAEVIVVDVDAVEGEILDAE